MGFCLQAPISSLPFPRAMLQLCFDAFLFTSLIIASFERKYPNDYCFDSFVGALGGLNFFFHFRFVRHLPFRLSTRLCWSGNGKIKWTLCNHYNIVSASISIAVWKSTEIIRNDLNMNYVWHNRNHALFSLFFSLFHPFFSKIKDINRVINIQRIAIVKSKFELSAVIATLQLP